MWKAITATRKELLAALSDRTQAALKLCIDASEDEFLALTGYRRKHVIYVSRAKFASKEKRIYD